MQESRAPGHGAKNHRRKRVTRGGGQAESARSSLRSGPAPHSAAKARPASADATLEERLGEGQLSRKGQERGPATKAAAAERKGRGTSRARVARRRAKDAASSLHQPTSRAKTTGRRRWARRNSAILRAPSAGGLQRAPRHECSHHTGEAGRPNPGETRELCQPRAGRRPSDDFHPAVVEARLRSARRDRCEGAVSAGTVGYCGEGRKDPAGERARLGLQQGEGCRIKAGGQGLENSVVAQAPAKRQCLFLLGPSRLSASRSVLIVGG